jgi:hypothetical protein
VFGLPEARSRLLALWPVLGHCSDPLEEFQRTSSFCTLQRFPGKATNTAGSMADNEFAPAVTPYNACLGQFRERGILRRSWNYLSRVSTARPEKKMRLDDSSKYGERKAIPLDMLPVNLDKLSVPPKTNFFTNIVVPFAMPIPNSCSLSVRALEIAHRIYL